MARLNEVLNEVLADKRITDSEVATIRSFIEQDGKLDLQDVKFLVELLSHAKEVCPPLIPSPAKSIAKAKG